MKRRMAIIVIMVVALSALFAIRPLKQFLDSDVCLDRGGAWDKQALTCAYAIKGASQDTAEKKRE